MLPVSDGTVTVADTIDHHEYQQYFVKTGITQLFRFDIYYRQIPESVHDLKYRFICWCYQNNLCDKTIDEAIVLWKLSHGH